MNMKNGIKKIGIAIILGLIALFFGGASSFATVLVLVLYMEFLVKKETPTRAIPKYSN